MNLKYLDDDYYSIMIGENGDKVVVLQGYYYYAEDSCTDNPDETYRDVTYSTEEIPLADFIKMTPDEINEMVSEWKQWIGDMTEEEVAKAMEEIKVTELGWEKLTMDTPCGDYVNH